MFKISRADHDVTVYMRDDINGVASVPRSMFDAYIEALEVINNFEQEVDRQYQIKAVEN